VKENKMAKRYRAQEQGM